MPLPLPAVERRLWGQPPFPMAFDTKEIKSHKSYFICAKIFELILFPKCFCWTKFRIFWYLFCCALRINVVATKMKLWSVANLLHPPGDSKSDLPYPQTSEVTVPTFAEVTWTHHPKKVTFHRRPCQVNGWKWWFPTTFLCIDLVHHPTETTNN